MVAAPLDILEHFFFVFFLFDVGLKMLAHQGIISYLKPFLNQVDCASTTIINTVMLTLRHPDLSSLRMLRLVVVLAIARNSTSFHRLRHMFGSRSQLAVIMVSHFLMFAYVVLLGQQMLGKDVLHFSSYGQSFISCTELAARSGRRASPDDLYDAVANFHT
jgi:hypothetical protein